MRRMLAIALALVLALGVMSMGTVAASERLVDEKAKLDLHATMMAPEGAMGTAELELRIDADGMFESAKVKADAEGLIAGVTYSLWVGKVFIGSAVADDNGVISISADLDDFAGYTTLLGLKVRIIEGESYAGTVVLCGKVMVLEEGSVSLK